jgi:antitoxin ParD1/3/4
MTIELSREQEALIEKQLASGRYHSRAEVIAEALELLDDQAQLEEAKLARLRSEIQKGLASPSEPLDMDSIIAEAEARHQQRNAH